MLILLLQVSIANCHLLLGLSSYLMLQSVLCTFGWNIGSIIMACETWFDQDIDRLNFGDMVRPKIDVRTWFDQEKPCEDMVRPIETG